MLRARGVAERLRRALWLRRGMVKETTSGATRADVTARRGRERVRVLASVNGWPVNVHRREWRVRGNMTRVVEHNRRRGTALERSW